MVRIRRKGVAIVKSRRGILVVAGRDKKFMLPGGGANKGESRKKASMRELKEETGLIPLTAKFFCSYEGRVWKDYKDRNVKNSTKVFVVNAWGWPKPKHEIKHVEWWKKGKNINLTASTSHIIKKYLRAR